MRKLYISILLAVTGLFLFINSLLSLAYKTKYPIDAQFNSQDFINLSLGFFLLALSILIHSQLNERYKSLFRVLNILLFLSFILFVVFILLNSFTQLNYLINPPTLTV